MPRNSQGVFQLASSATVNSGDVISAANYNSTIQDLASEQTALRPIAAGGTNASSAADARANLGVTALLADKMDADASIPPSQITDLDNHIKDTAGGILVGDGDNSGSGHITVQYNASTNVATISSAATDTTYTASGDFGLTLDSTTNTFKLEDDRRRNSNTADIYSGNMHDYTFYDASLGIRWYTAGAEEMRLTDNGTLHVDNDIVAFSTTVSDPRLKTDVVRIDDALERVQALTGYEFTYKCGGRASAGVMSDEIGQVLPSAVTRSELPFQGEEGELYDVVQYDQLHALLIEAVKTLADRVEALENGN